MDPSRRSWTFLHRSLPDRPEVGVEGTVPEPLYGLTHIAQLYEMADKGVKQGPYPVRGEAAGLSFHKRRLDGLMCDEDFV